MRCNTHTDHPLVVVDGAALFHTERSLFYLLNVTIPTSISRFFQKGKAHNGVDY